MKITKSRKSKPKRKKKPVNLWSDLIQREVSERVEEKTSEIEKSLALVRATLESTTDGILVVSREGHIIDCNKKFGEMWKIPPAIIESGDENKAFEHVLSQVADPKALYEQVTRLYENLNEQGELGEVVFKDGRVFERYSQPHRLSDQIVGRVWSFRDITERKHHEEALRLRERAIESNPTGIFIIDVKTKDHLIIYINPAFSTITGISSDKIIGKPYKILFAHEKDNVVSQRVKFSIERCNEDNLILHQEMDDNQSTWQELRIAPVPNESGDVTHYVGIIQDITEQKKLENQLLHQATHDPLTNSPNRALLMDRLQQSILQAKRLKQFIGVMFLDLDRFKLINDTLGHNQGDKLLVLVTERLKQCLREGDTIGRIGGDEFVLILPALKSLEEAIPIGQRIIDAFSDPFRIEGNDLNITTSIGISYYPKDGNDFETLIKNADMSMYQAKDLGRNNFQFYTTELNRQLTRRLTLENHLRNALQRNEFELHYQPLLDVSTSKFVGVEALIRWNDTHLGRIPPLEFIPFAEENGMINSIGEWVLKTAAEQCWQWNKEIGYGISMAVNVSVRQLQNALLKESLKKIIDTAQIQPQYIDLELTESMLMEHADEMVIILHELKSLGVNIVIDDFGTGYSCLNYLKQFPIDKIKIDRSFIHDLNTNSNSVSIVEAIVGLAKSLRLKTVAEGVETKEQVEFLKKLQCDEMQGFYFSKPVTQVEMTKLLFGQKNNLG